MTPPVDDPKTVRRILANTDALLLDFDGPICNVFAGIPASVVAEQLRDILAEAGHTHLPDNVRTATDPFDILRHAATLGEEETRYVEAAFTAHEVEAIQTAQPTPGAHDLIHTWHATGRPLAIVSNNSAVVVETYLALHGLRREVDRISARISPDIALLKPNPYLIISAFHALAAGPGACTLIGDSMTDVEAAHAAEVCVIAYANKPGKAERLTNAEPAAVTTNLAHVAAVVPYRRSRGHTRS